MKQTILAISFLFLVFQSFGQTKVVSDDFKISGHITGWNNEYIYFSHQGIGKGRIWDSTIVKDNRFEFEGKLQEPANGFITTLKFDRMQNLDDNNITQRLFISPSNMTIKLSPNNLQNAKLFRSKVQDEYYRLEKSKENINILYTPISKMYDSLGNCISEIKSGKDSFVLIRLERQMDSLGKQLDILNNKSAKIDYAFFKNNPNSYVTAFMLADYYNHLTLIELNQYYNAMQPKNKQWEYGLKLKEAIIKLTKGSPGGIAINFSEIDLNGDSISLAEFKEQYVLLDFWASWCKPCRAGNPELIELYKKYKSDGIEFIGIALDKGSEDKWKSAISKDNIGIWRHIIDNKIGDNYSVSYIPLQILIDKDGKIIGRFGEGGEPNKNLSKRLKEVFGK